jgi:hypothetical protein
MSHKAANEPIFFKEVSPTYAVAAEGDIDLS